MSNEISSFGQSRNKLNMINLFRLCQKDEISFDIVAEIGNYVEATFDFVKRTKFYNRIVRYCCRLWQQSRTLLRHCCWCGRGVTERSHWCARTRSDACERGGSGLKKNLASSAKGCFSTPNRAWLLGSCSLTPVARAGIRWKKVDSNIRPRKYSNIRIFTSTRRHAL